MCADDGYAEGFPSNGSSSSDVMSDISVQGSAERCADGVDVQHINMNDIASKVPLM